MIAIFIYTYLNNYLYYILNLFLSLGVVWHINKSNGKFLHGNT